MEEKTRILLCEDDENLGMLLREYLQAKGYATDLLPDGDAGYKAFVKAKYDICVLDVMMTQMQRRYGSLNKKNLANSLIFHYRLPLSASVRDILI